LLEVLAFFLCQLIKAGSWRTWCSSFINRRHTDCALGFLVERTFREIRLNLLFKDLLPYLHYVFLNQLWHPLLHGFFGLVHDLLSSHFRTHSAPLKKDPFQAAHRLMIMLWSYRLAYLLGHMLFFILDNISLINQKSLSPSRLLVNQSLLNQLLSKLIIGSLKVLLWGGTFNRDTFGLARWIALNVGLLSVCGSTSTGRWDIDHLNNGAGSCGVALVSSLMLLNVTQVVMVVRKALRVGVVSFKGGVAAWLDPRVLKTSSTLVRVHNCSGWLRP
jgi:hypothetical protein